MTSKFRYIDNKGDYHSLEYLHLHTNKEKKVFRLDDQRNNNNIIWVKFSEISEIFHEEEYYENTEDYIQTTDSEEICKVLNDYWGKIEEITNENFRTFMRKL